MNIMICATQFKGGSLQVVISLINEFKNFPENTYHIVISDNVAKQIDRGSFPTNFNFYDYSYSGPISLRRICQRDKFLSKIEVETKPDCIITTSGPLYWHAKAPVLMGYNLPNNIYTDSPFFKLVPFKKRIKWWFKKQVHRYFFKRDADAFFVQTEDVNRRLRKYLGTEAVYTISNTYNNFFVEKPTYPPKLPAKKSGEIRLLTISTWYPHKNFEIIKPVVLELKKRGITNVKFFLTLKKDKFQQIFGETDDVINVGPISAGECPSLYEECDFMFLPTLLECFSASYAEAMIMKKPILTSNLDFATVVCKDAALYFDPIDPIDIANKIELLVNHPEHQTELQEKGLCQLSQFGTAQDRARQILNLCEHLKQTHNINKEI
ncbi:MAG: glycosyltransferase [Muribaculum sp.]|nr:glycosyltransferase [Muribaculum sp.]